jgi:hypothetical protein
MQHFNLFLLFQYAIYRAINARLGDQQIQATVVWISSPLARVTVQQDLGNSSGARELDSHAGGNSRAVPREGLTEFRSKWHRNIRLNAVRKPMASRRLSFVLPSFLPKFFCDRNSSAS